MIGLLVATVVFLGLVCLVLVVLVAVTALPLFVALQMADARRFSTGRWTWVASAGIVVGLGMTYVLHKHDAPRIVTVLPLALTWIGPALLWLLEEGQVRVGGRAGQHE